MNKFADLVVDHSSQLGQLDTMVTGKPAMFGNFEPRFVGECFKCKFGPSDIESYEFGLILEDYSGFVDKLEGEYLPTNDGKVRVRHHVLAFGLAGNG